MANTMTKNYQWEDEVSCLDSAYERKAVEEGMNKNPVFPENKTITEYVSQLDYPLNSSKIPISTALSKSHPLWDVYEDAVAQVENGKGKERHGQGKSFYDHPWVELADTHGIGFLSAQAAKKLTEAMTAYGKEGCSDGWWEREMLGAINYAAMTILFNRYKNDNSRKS